MTDALPEAATLQQRIEALSSLPLDARAAELTALEALLRENLGSSDEGEQPQSSQ